jgi:type IV pilus assembly protein PilQ
MLAFTGLALLMSPARANGPGEVTAVSVLPGAGRALVIIDVRGSVNVQDFTLANPARLVIDVQGATLRAPNLRYDGSNRGGILNVRYSQFRPDVVRIVLEMESLKDYELEYVDDAIRISFGTDRNFAAWSSSTMMYGAGVSTMPQPTTPVAQPLPMPQQSQQAMVTASWDQASVTDVMIGFSELTGRTIVLGSDVAGTVTAEIRNQPWDVAFQAILDAQGLAAIEEPSGIIRVDTKENLTEAERTAPMTTEIISVNFARAGELATTLQGIRFEGDSSQAGEQVIADVATNSLIVTATATRMTAIRSLVGSLDIETPQVSIQARIINVSRSDLQQIGLEYDFGDDSRGTFYNTSVARPDPAAGIDINGDGIFDIFEPYNAQEDPFVVGLGGDALAAVANAGRSVANPALDVLLTTTINRFNFTAFLQVLKEVSLADEQAEPLISTSDNVQATLLVGEETPVRVIDASAAGAGAASIDLIPTGISLTVTPHVTANRRILLDIIAENSSAEEVSTDLGFKFNRQRAQSQIMVNDGQTAVIGGMTRTSVQVSKSGIPYLMDLPIIGALFSVNSRRESRTDLLILVTPRIIDNPEVVGGN